MPDYPEYDHVSSPLHLYKEFLTAQTAPDVLATFYKLQNVIKLASRTTEICHPYFLFREKVLNLCANYFRGKRILEKLDKKVELTCSPTEEDQLVTVVGAGPIGLRCAIELALQQGNQVTVVEQRTPKEVAARPNVLKLWKWAFADLQSLGVETKFMNGKGNKHIRTDTLQIELIRIALILGVKFLFGSTFLELKPNEAVTEPGEGKWKVLVDSSIAIKYALAEDPDAEERRANLETLGLHLKGGDQLNTSSVLKFQDLSCDTVVGAGGVRDPVRKLYNFNTVTTRMADAVGIVMFFENRQTKKEKAMNEVLWARQYNNPPLKDILEEAGGVGMENLVYFQTPKLHYVVFTPSRSSLVDLGVLNPKTNSVAVKNHAALEKFARNVANVLGVPEECQPHGSNAVKVFDFSMRSHVLNPCKILKHKDSITGKSISAFLHLAGDALLEPFWPEGLGINRGFMSAFDVAWAIRQSRKQDDKMVLDEREATYKAQRMITGNERAGGFEILRRNSVNFSVDPTTRYSAQAFTPCITAARKCNGDDVRTIYYK